MATWFEIADEELSVLRDKVVIVTGCASGIGLATVQLLLSLGAKVVGGDLNPLPINHPELTYQPTDVTSWTDLTRLFELGVSVHGGRVDHVFANAGISGGLDFTSLQSDPTTGQLLEPNQKIFDINLRSVVNTSALAFHYMKLQQPPGGSVVVTASASSFQRFIGVDYATAKHGVLGFMRGMVPVLKKAGLAVRINGIAPSWTRTGLVPAGLAEKAGKASQSAEVVARSVAILMADQNHTGHLIYSEQGKYKEIDEAILLPVVSQIFDNPLDDNTVMERILTMWNETKKEEQVKGERATASSA